MAQNQGANELDNVDLDELEEEEGEVDGTEKVARTRNPLLIASRQAMEELDKLEFAPRKRGDADKAQELVKQMVAGRISAQTSPFMRRAILSYIDAAFKIADQQY